ncbi:hypothetical protein T4B_14272 [Trichinella pseudospiralis]|uniref:DNA-directed RNA polymerase II subunit RPB1 n=2 Tax=Trichinella pseudospiralis TaxID=6337 RepID=A0A0V1EH26_TRIPS|nr:hypothetical protein T4A_5032 [Trichinella pseudospiralis]KRY86774.1 hypothetical protein T4D_8254 [Trichinella pseudospiralis]KRZ27772.1 hypothetical protein T4B_14272 [Trichinella pseudospiralis]KRZ39178.1 hypothetical protein T4C_2963 [Trichinella pseudospiralis]
MAVCFSRLLNFLILLLACTTALVLCSNEETPEIEPKQSPVLNSKEVATADAETSTTPPVKKRKRVSFSSAVKVANIPDKESVNEFTVKESITEAEPEDLKAPAEVSSNFTKESYDIPTDFDSPRPRPLVPPKHQQPYPSYTPSYSPSYTSSYSSSYKPSYRPSYISSQTPRSYSSSYVSSYEIKTRSYYPSYSTNRPSIPTYSHPSYSSSYLSKGSQYRPSQNLYRGSSILGQNSYRPSYSSYGSYGSSSSPLRRY